MHARADASADTLRPVEELMGLLRPKAVLSKVIDGAGEWSVRKPRYAEPAFCLMLSGACLLEADGLEPMELRDGDFLFFPETPAFTLASDRGLRPTERALDFSRDTRHGDPAGPVTMRMLGGYFRFDGASARLLVSLLPRFVLVRGEDDAASRLHRIVALIAEEAGGDRPCRDMILERLVEVLVVEAVRLHTSPIGAAEQGILAGLSDPVLAPALRQLHADIADEWTVERLARAARVSRAVLAERFTRTVGLPPMRYVMHWRIAVARNLLRSDDLSVAEVARRVGYQSASAFTSAFIRVVGCSPTEFARSARDPAS